MFTNREKALAISRELGFRRRVYARKVADQSMTQAKADQEIGIFEAIKRDYEAAAQADDARDRPRLAL